MSNGGIENFGTPEALLADKSTILYELFNKDSNLESMWLNKLKIL